MVKTEAEFKSQYQDSSKEQVIDALYQLQLKYDHLEEINNNLKRVHFGKKSEHVAKGQLSLFNEAEETVEDATPEELEEPEITVPSYKKKKSKKKGIKDLPIKVVEDIYPKSKNCPECGSQMKELKPIFHDYLVHVKEEYRIERHVEHVYVCDKCSKETDSLVTVKADTSNLPPRLFEGSVVTSEVLARIAYEKIVMCIPFYRQQKDFSYNGIAFSRQILCNWFIKGAKDYLEFVFHKMEDDFRKLEVAHGDETTLTCLENQKDRQESYVWLLMSGRLEEIQMALYYYNDTRKYEFLDKIIPGDWNGLFHSDAYDAYKKCKGISLLCGCWAHARRKVYEAMTSNTEVWKEYHNKKTTSERRRQILQESPRFRYSLQLLDEIAKLFAIEAKLQDQNASVEDIFNVRQEKAPEIFERIYSLCNTIQANFASESKLAQASRYITNQWGYLTNYVKDGRADISNNRCERDGIKPYVMSRKNFLFSATRDGAKYSCMYFSLIISAVMNNLKPEAYLTYAFNELSAHGLHEDVIERVLPYSKSLPDHLKVTH